MKEWQLIGCVSGKTPKPRQCTVDQLPFHVGPKVAWDPMKRNTGKSKSGSLLLLCWHSDPDPDYQQEDELALPLQYKAEGHQGISIITNMICIQNKSHCEFSQQLTQRKRPDTERAVGDEHPCLLHGWAVSHSAKQASSQRRKRQQHEEGNTLPARLHLHADITTCGLKALFRSRLCCWQTPEVLLTGDILGRLSTGLSRGQGSSAGKAVRHE